MNIDPPSEAPPVNKPSISWVLLMLCIGGILSCIALDIKAKRKAEGIKEITIRIDAKNSRILAIEDQRKRPLTNYSIRFISPVNPADATEWENGYFEGIELGFRATAEMETNGINSKKFYNIIVTRLIQQRAKDAAPQAEEGSKR